MGDDKVSVPSTPKGDVRHQRSVLLAARSQYARALNSTYVALSALLPDTAVLRSLKNVVFSIRAEIPTFRFVFVPF